MSDVSQEQLNTALAIQGLGKDTEYIKLQLNNLDKKVETFVTKAEAKEMQSDFNATIRRIEKEMVEHNRNDEQEFSTIKKGHKEVERIVWKGIGAMTVVSILVPIVVKFLIQ